MSETAQNEILTQKQPATLREALLKTIEKIKADARAAEVSFGAQTYLEAGTRCESPASAEQIRELVAVVQKTCPVLDILRRPIDTESEVMLNGASLAL